MGGRGASRLKTVGQGDDVNVDGAPFFVNSSLSPVLLKSVADVLRGIKRRGYTQTRWDAFRGEEVQKSAQWFADLDSFLATPWAREAAARGSQERKRKKKKRRKRKVPKTSFTVPRQGRRLPRRGAEAQVVLAAFVVNNGGKFLAGFAFGEAGRAVFFPIVYRLKILSASYFVWTRRTVTLYRARRWQRLVARARLVLLVTTLFVLYPFLLSSGPRCSHLGRYGPEEQLSVVVAVHPSVVVRPTMPLSWFVAFLRAAARGRLHVVPAATVSS